MPAMATLIDIAKRNGSDPLVGLIDETTRAHPEFTSTPARTIKGTSFKTRIRKALGQVTGGFRSANAGITPVKSTSENRTVETFILEVHFQVDKAVADSSEDGPGPYLAEEADAMLEGEMQGLARQYYYGTTALGNSTGFPGLVQGYDANNMAVDAGGTTASTGSSVWLIKHGPKDVIWVWGTNGQLKLTPEPSKVLDNPIILKDPADSTKQFLGYFQALNARPGLAVNSLNSTVRIKKLTAEVGCGLTDAKIADALALFPVGQRPDVIRMNRRSLVQLQKSRTPVIQTGAQGKPGGGVEASAPLPDSAFGIPIEVTDAISSVEPLTL